MDKTQVDSKHAKAGSPSLTIAHDDALALVSHELRTPLTVITGMSAALQRDTCWAANGGDARRAQALADIFDAGKRMERMVENVLLLATTADEPFDPEPLNIRALIEEALVRHHGDFPASVVIFDRSPPSLVAVGIPTWVGLILANVLRNAAQYGAAGEAIRISTRGDGQQISIRIEDGGPALTVGEYQQMFEPFYRGPRTELRVTGAGLGLTVARRLAGAQGGSIVAGTIAGGSGTVVTIALPAATDA